MGNSKRKDFFALRYPDLKPVYLDRLGTEFQIVGMIIQGKGGMTVTVALPGHRWPEEHRFVSPKKDEWIDILKHMDDPHYFETADDGKTVKAIHRKCQRSVAYEIQWEVYRKAGFKCEYCHNERPLTIDHKIPVELGGTDEITNYAAACRPCNRDKANMPWEKWVEVMKKRGWTYV